MAIRDWIFPPRATAARDAGTLPGVLTSRRLAEPALLRIFSRARRQGAVLTLLYVRPGPEAAARGHSRFLGLLASELRLADLIWCEPGGVVVALLEACDDAAPVMARLELRAREAGAQPLWGAASFPAAGLTLEALLTAAATRALETPDGAAMPKAAQWPR